MIVVFVSTLMLQVFTVYFLIKSVAMNFSLDVGTSVDFAISALFFCTPEAVAIYVGSVAVAKAKTLRVFVGKYSNFSNDEICSLKVRRKKKRIC